MASARFRVLLFGAILVLLANVAVAQPDVSNVRGELERTDRILERAKEQIGLSVSSASLMQLLDRSQELQREAWQSFHAGGTANLKKALALTVQARELARRALETAVIEVKAHEAIRDLIESTKELAQEAAPLVRERGDPRAQRLLDGGMWQLERAEEAYRAKEYRKAIRLADAARSLVRRAMEQARGDSSGGIVSMDAALDRSGALLEELHAALGQAESPQAQALYEEALRLQERAREMQRSQRLALALRLTTQARETALRGLLLLAENPNHDEVERALTAVEQLIADLAPDIVASGSSEALSLLDSARQRHREAGEQLAKDQLGQALRAARVAEDLLGRAAEAAGIR